MLEGFLAQDNEQTHEIEAGQQQAEGQTGQDERAPPGPPKMAEAGGDRRGDGGINWAALNKQRLAAQMATDPRCPLADRLLERGIDLLLILIVRRPPGRERDRGHS